MIERSPGGGCAVLLNTASGSGHKRMNVGLHCAGQVWEDIFAWPDGGAASLHAEKMLVDIDVNGWGVFSVGPTATAVFARTERHEVLVKDSRC